jgi:hypothetical protein
MVYQTKPISTLAQAGLRRSHKYEEVHLKAYADARGARRHRIMDELLISSPPASGDEQPVSDCGIGVPAWTRPRRQSLWICRFAWTTQMRCPHTHSRRKSSSRKLLERQRQARSHLYFGDPWSQAWGSATVSAPEVRFTLCAYKSRYHFASV